MTWVIENILVRCECGALFDKVTEWPPIPRTVTHYEIHGSQGDPDGYVMFCPSCDSECEDATPV